jgi:hypothetical protein
MTTDTILTEQPCGCRWMDRAGVVNCEEHRREPVAVEVKQEGDDK